MLFIWTKGAKIRREIIKLMNFLEGNEESIFLSKITEEINKFFQEKTITISVVRFHLKSLIKYGLVQEINKGGKPEYLKLTQEGLDACERLKAENGKNLR
jgi:repressor of nif and glnA expression